MKKALLLFALLCAASMGFAGVEKMPPTLAPKDLAGEALEKAPIITVFQGGRPWEGNGKCEMLVKAGFRAVNVNGTYLDGLGGATIKVNMTDKVEPEAFNGIDPALKDLDPAKQSLVLFQSIFPQYFDRVLTPERIALLRKYVEAGGNVLFTVRAQNVAGDLLPVELGKSVTVRDGLWANRPASPAFAMFPEKLPVFNSYREAVIPADAEVISAIRDEKGEIVAPYIVRKKLGKGTVTYFNGELVYAHQLKEMENWAYGKAFFVSVVADAAGHPVNTEKFVVKMQDIPERTPVDTVSVSVQPPELSVTEVQDAPVLEDKKVRFGNGIVLELFSNGSISLSWPELKEPLFRKIKVPQISYSADRTFFDKNTAEATDGEAQLTSTKIRWKAKGIAIDGNNAIITYKAKDDSEMRWIFTAGTMNLDGRVCTGIAEHLEVSKCPFYINSIAFIGELTPEEPLFAHRNSCYSPPRGYAQFDMSGKKDGDTSFWNWFGSGQPFELLVCKNGIYMDNVEEGCAFSTQMCRRKGDDAINNEWRIGVGRVHAPLTTKRVWHWYSAGAERPHNDYLAMFQFQRKSLRKKAGLQELPAYPTCKYTHQISPEEQKAVREAAVKAGFRFLGLTGCEEPADVSYRKERFDLVSDLLNRGTASHIWTAGSYVQGDGGWIYNNHPEWFVRDKDNKIFTYGDGRYPVIDVNNEEYHKWFFELAKPAIDAGIRWVYRDMDGAAANCVNYAKPESPHGMASQIKIYKFLQENGCRVSIEGMNPLVIDEYWYRPQLYTPFAGNEFCLVGSVPSANFYEFLELDFFRTGMYGTFIAGELSGYTFQFDRVKDEVVRVNRMVSLLPKFNEALDNTGMPYVRETPFGTTWIGENGGALFFWNPTKKVTVELPAGWSIRGVKGNVLTDVPADAVFYLDKAK